MRSKSEIEERLKECQKERDSTNGIERMAYVNLIDELRFVLNEPFRLRTVEEIEARIRLLKYEKLLAISFRETVKIHNRITLLKWILKNVNEKNLSVNWLELADNNKLPERYLKH